MAAIENIISTTDDDNVNYIEFRDDLDMYSNLTSFLKFEKDEIRNKELVDQIQGKAKRLYRELYDTVSSKLAENIAEDFAFEGSPIESAEDVLKPVKDVNLLGSMVFGASYSNNPIVAGVYKQVQERLYKARTKAQQLGKEITGMVSELKTLLGTTGEALYEPFLQTRNGKKTGYVVREFKSEFYERAKEASLEGDLAWFSENSKFDSEKYMDAKKRFEDYLSSTMTSEVARKLVYIKSSEKTKGLTEDEQNALAERYAKEEQKKVLEEWVKNNKTIVKYHKPNLNWRDPKWIDIKEGKYKGTVVERFYDKYTSIMEELEDGGLPFYVSENFIPEFSKSFLNMIMDSGVGNLKLGKSLLDSISITYDEAEVNKINPFTGRFMRNIPVLGKKNFRGSQEREEFTQKEKSYDLGYSLALFYESALRYQELRAIESTIHIAQSMLTEQKEKVLNATEIGRAHV